MRIYNKSISYTGTKNKLLDFIVPKIKEANPTILISPFCGSLAVEMNIKCKQYYLNDKLAQLIGCYMGISRRNIDGDEMIRLISKDVKRFNLSNSNSESYKEFREYYNNRYIDTIVEPSHFLTILLHSFNNQIRFNKKGDFNLPFGKRTLNESNEIGIRNLCDFIHDNKVMFTHYNFDQFIDNITTYIYPDSEVIPLYYLDPPYNNTVATYNENNWNDEQEQLLYKCIDRINFYGNKFVMSNVLEHNGVENTMLKRYVDKKGYKYDIVDYNYGNSAYNKKNRNKSIECIIYNY